MKKKYDYSLLVDAIKDVVDLGYEVNIKISPNDKTIEMNFFMEKGLSLPLKQYSSVV